MRACNFYAIPQNKIPNSKSETQTGEKPTQQSSSSKKMRGITQSSPSTILDSALLPSLLLPEARAMDTRR